MHWHQAWAQTKARVSQEFCGRRMEWNEYGRLIKGCFIPSILVKSKSTSSGCVMLVNQIGGFIVIDPRMRYSGTQPRIYKLLHLIRMFYIWICACSAFHLLLKIWNVCPQLKLRHSKPTARLKSLSWLVTSSPHETDPQLVLCFIKVSLYSAKLHLRFKPCFFRPNATFSLS